MAAAAADFRAAEPAGGKLVREGDGGLELRLEPTEDVLAGLAAPAPRRPDLVGFAAETGADASTRARAKLERKGVDAIVFNDVSRSEIGFDSSRQRGHDRRARRRAHVPQASKDEIAEAILDRVEALARRRPLEH